MIIFNILLTLFFVLLNAFFVAAEFAIVKVRTSQIELRYRAGSRIAGVAKNIINHLDAYLSACQLGITLASLGLGWIGESVVSSIILDATLLFGLDIDPEFAHSAALPAAFITITFLHIVFGELMPKTIAIQKPESVTLVLSLPLRIFYILFKPFIISLNGTANWLIKLMGYEIMTEEQELHSSEELRYLIKESTDSGLIDTTEHKMLENVFEFSDTPVKQIMVPHNHIIGVDLEMGVKSMIDKFIEEGVSRMPVYKETVDNIKGGIYAKDMLSLLQHENLIIIEDLIRPALLVHEDEKISKLLSDLQREKVHLAIVVDDFGGTAGIVTLEDILEEIVGEIQDEYDEEQPVVIKLSDIEYQVDAFTIIDDANDILPVELPESDDYETVGGLIMNEIGRIPEEGELIMLKDYNCKIASRSKRNIETVVLIRKQNS